MNQIVVIRSFIILHIYRFKDSFLYYPVIFTIGGIILFLLTSQLDESLDRSYYVDNDAISSYLEPLIFAGSPDAARSILSTIATGWATVLGVAFSVTLITLQLSVTRYVSEVINEFQNSRTNQFALAWFMLTVTYSLLVLKTVRTGENEIPTFAPILGVNISVYLAIAALFVFVLFLNNITSYLKPNLLIERIVEKMYRSIELFQNRVPDRRFIFRKNNNNPEVNRSKILEIRSPGSGFIRSVDWKKISDHMGKHSELKKLEQEEPWLLLEWLSPLGGDVKKKEIIAIMYRYGEISQKMLETTKNMDGDFERMLQATILSGLEIGKTRNLSSDPSYGLEMIRNLAIKAINQSDIETTTSCIKGLFKILYRTIEIGELSGTPFMIPLAAYRKNSNNGVNNRFLVTTNSSEQEIAEAVLSELSVLYHVSSKSEECRISVAEYFATSYVTLSRELLGEDRKRDFERVTEWYSRQTSSTRSSHPQEFPHRVVDILSQFRDEISYRHPYAKDTVQVYLNKILESKT
jgi:hypothetical protein